MRLAVGDGKLMYIIIIRFDIININIINMIINIVEIFKSLSMVSSESFVEAEGACFSVFLGLRNLILPGARGDTWGCQG